MNSVCGFSLYSVNAWDRVFGDRRIVDNPRSVQIKTEKTLPKPTPSDKVPLPAMLPDPAAKDDNLKVIVTSAKYRIQAVPESGKTEVASNEKENEAIKAFRTGATVSESMVGLAEKFMEYCGPGGALQETEIKSGNRDSEWLDWIGNINGSYICSAVPMGEARDQSETILGAFYDDTSNDGNPIMYVEVLDEQNAKKAYRVDINKIDARNATLPEIFALSTHLSRQSSPSKIPASVDILFMMCPPDNDYKRISFETRMNFVDFDTCYDTFRASVTSKNPEQAPVSRNTGKPLSDSARQIAVQDVIEQHNTIEQQADVRQFVSKLLTKILYQRNDSKSLSWSGFSMQL